MIKFNKHNVTNGTDKARVHYSAGDLLDGRKCVTLYAKDYGHALARVLAAVQGTTYTNDTDTQADYFDTGKVRIFESHPLYAAALERARTNDAEVVARQLIRDANRRAKRTLAAA